MFTLFPYQLKNIEIPIGPAHTFPTLENNRNIW